MSNPPKPPLGVQSIQRASLPVADLTAMTDFYKRALGFRVLRSDRSSGAEAQSVVLGLGQQKIALVRFDPPGAPYPRPRSAADPWFQHLAIVVSDMTGAYAQLCAHGGAEPISQGGPQLLPPSTGAVTAYKFRDPEGHPLELSFFPPGVGAPQWQARHSLFLGIDHSAIAVADLDVSVAFYQGILGFAVAPLLVNSGPTQARLDGLSDPVVDIVAVYPPAGPHLELLGYRSPTAPPPRELQPADIAATELTMATFDPAALKSRLASAGFETVTRQGPSEDDPSAGLWRDPDGHLLRIEQAQEPMRARPGRSASR